jgi:hypothetical protein
MRREHGHLQEFSGISRTKFRASKLDCEPSERHAVYRQHQHDKTVAEDHSECGQDAFLPLYETLGPWD